MRLRRFVLVEIVMIMTLFLPLLIPFVLASTSWTQTNWSDNSFSTSSDVTTSVSNQITLQQKSGWFDSTWKYRQNVSISNSSGGTLTSYQIPLYLNTASLISNSKMNSDCSDLRITDSAGNALVYWIATSPSANTCNQTATKIWVKVTSLTTSGDTLYLYYGNSSASASSNGSSVFISFADFTTGTSLPSGLTKKDIGTSGTATVDNGTLSITNTNGEDIWNSVYGGTHVYFDASISGSFTAEALLTYQSNSNEWSKTGISIQNSVASGGGNGQAMMIATPGNGTPFQYQSTTGELCTSGSCPKVIAPNVNDGSAASSTTLPLYLKITKDSSNQISGYQSANGTSWTQKENNATPWGISNTQYVSLIITPHTTSATGTAKYTIFYIRKYSATEPSVNSPSEEETPYATSGILSSSVIDTGSSTNFGSLTYSVTTPANTSAVVKVRSSNNASMSEATNFSSCNNIASSTDISSNNCITDGHRYLQYQITLSSTNGLSTPVFQSISLDYTPTFTVTYQANSHGTISGSSSQVVNSGSDTAEVTAVANSGYHFTNWSDGRTSNPRTDINVTTNKTVSANFAADDTNSPIISFLNSTPSTNSAIITWNTNEAASTQVQYGLNTSYGFSSAETDTTTRVTNHNQNLTNLKSCARYYYRVISSDVTGNQSASSQNSFNTTGCAASSISNGTESNLPVTGGSVSLVNNNSTAQLTVPNNYAAEQATFQLNTLNTSSVPSTPNGQEIANNNFYDLVAVTDDDVQLTSFSQPITFTISYGADTESEFDESTLDVYKYDGSSWNKKSCTLNTSANTLTCTLYGFSVYGVLGQKRPSITSTSNTSTSSSTQSCNDPKPQSSPDLFQINSSPTSAKIFFTPLSDTQEYYISYSTSPNAEGNSAQVTLAKEGVQNFTIKSLKSNTTYYIKIRGQIGCMPGSWSNIFIINTSSKTYYKYNQAKPISRTSATSKIVPTISTPTNKISPIAESKTQTNKTQKHCFLWWCWN